MVEDLLATLAPIKPAVWGGIMCDEPHADYTDQRIRHLEMIQGVIVHYSDCSARVKNLALLVGWTILLGFMIGGISVVSESARSPIGILLGMIIAFLLVFSLNGINVICFWLDIHYYQKAKKFCKLYDRVNAQPFGQRPNFYMTLPLDIAKIKITTPKPTIAFYVSLSVYYFMAIGVAVFLLFVIL